MIYCVIISREGYGVESVKAYKDYFVAENEANNFIKELIKEDSLEKDFKFPNYRQGENFILDGLRVGVYNTEIVN